MCSSDLWIIPGMIAKELTGRRAQWKRDLAERLVFDPSELEYHKEFLDWLTGQQAKGRTLALAPASDSAWAPASGLI